MQRYCWKEIWRKWNIKRQRCENINTQTENNRRSDRQSSRINIVVFTKWTNWYKYQLIIDKHTIYTHISIYIHIFTCVCVYITHVCMLCSICPVSIDRYFSVPSVVIYHLMLCIICLQAFGFSADRITSLNDNPESIFLSGSTYRFGLYPLLLLPSIFPCYYSFSLWGSSLITCPLRRTVVLFVYWLLKVGILSLFNIKFL